MLYLQIYNVVDSAFYTQDRWSSAYHLDISCDKDKRMYLLVIKYAVALFLLGWEDRMDVLPTRHVYVKIIIMISLY